MPSNKYTKSQIIIVIILLVFLSAQTIIGIFYNSVTWDELCFVGSGKAVLSTGNTRYTLLIDHPPLSYYLNSIFLLPLKFDKEISQNDWCYKTGHEVLFGSGYNPKFILFLSRLPFAILSIIFGLFVMKWAAELYGKSSGILALFLYSFNPSIIAYSGIATADFITAMMIFMAVYYFWKLIKSHSKKNLFLAGIFFGLAQLSKLTAIILIPIYLIIGVMAVIKKEKGLSIKGMIKNLSVIFLIAFILIWAFHLFQFGTLKDSLPLGYYSQKTREEISKAPFLSEYLIYIYDNVPMPMPIYIGMVGHIFYLSSHNKFSFIFGQIIDKPSWSMSFLTFLLKAPLALLILIAVLLISYRKLPKKGLTTNLCMILPIFFTFALFIHNSKFSGVRHLLTVYPFIFILSSNLISLRIIHKRAITCAFAVLYLVPSFLIAPHYLSYMNIFAGGPENAYNLVVGANIDQGQGLLELKGFMEKNNIDKINFSYWGSVDPKDYGIRYDYMPSPYFQPWQNDYKFITGKNIINEDCSERKGWAAISVTNLQNVHLENKSCYTWLSKHEPVKRIGYSIFVYYIK